MTAEQLARHEAGHAAACIVLGASVRVVSVAPDGTSLGRCCHDVEVSDGPSRVKRMVVVFCGLIEGASTWDEIPDWPLDPGRFRPGSDEHVLAVLAVGMTERDYRDILLEAVRLTLREDYRQIVVGITGLLDYTPTIDYRHIAELERRVYG